MSIADLVCLDDELLHALAHERVVVPNERLETALAAAFDRRQCETGRSAWRAANVLTLDALLAAHFDECSRRGALETRLLDGDGERALWREVLGPSVRCAPSASAWRLLHEYRLGERALDGTSTARQREFADACRALQRIAERERLTTTAELPGLLARAAPMRGSSETRVMLYGFERISPAHAHYFDAQFGDRAVHRAPTAATNATVRCRSYDDHEAELAAAIAWARAVLQSDAQAHVAILSADTSTRRSAFVRQLDAALRPGVAVPDADDAPYALAGATQLDSTALVATALELLRWIETPLPRDNVVALLSSPFLVDRRGARDDVGPHVLRNRLPEHGTLRVCAERSGDTLARALGATTRGWTQPRSIAGWCRDVLALLERALVPNASARPNTRLARGRFVQTLAALAATRSAHAIDYAGFLRAIEAACADATPPREPATAARLHVLGHDDAFALRFTHLWVTGVDDRSFPARPTTHPLLRADLQRAADVPRSSVESELLHCRNRIAHWRTSAPVVEFSFARERDDETRGPSPLIGPWEEVEPPRQAALHPYRRRRGVALVPVNEVRRPLSTPHRARRGTEVLVEQQRCPFQAFARNRLGLIADRPPHDFPDAVDRGELVHRALDAYARPHIGRRLVYDPVALARAIDGAIAPWRRFPAPVVALERRRLEALLSSYLAHDGRRARYVLEAVEHEVTTAPAGLELALRIDRIDRSDGGRLLLDYKTGRRRPFARPDDDAQLPLYATTVPDAIGVLRVDLRPEGCRTTAIAARADAVVAEPSSELRVLADTGADGWRAQRERWRDEITDLARTFVAGDARVAPRDAAACRGCGLDALCRIDRRADVL